MKYKGGKLSDARKPKTIKSGKPIQYADSIFTFVRTKNNTAPSKQQK